MLDILTAFNAPSVRQLGRDFSPYVAKHLVEMAARLQEQYSDSLWGGGGIATPNSDNFARYTNRVHFLAGVSFEFRFVVRVSCLVVFFSILLMSCFLWSGALESSGVLQSYSVLLLLLGFAN